MSKKNCTNCCLIFQSQLPAHNMLLRYVSNTTPHRQSNQRRFLGHTGDQIPTGLVRPWLRCVTLVSIWFRRQVVDPRGNEDIRFRQHQVRNTHVVVRMNRGNRVRHHRTSLSISMSNQKIPTSHHLLPVLSGQHLPLLPILHLIMRSAGTPSGVSGARRGGSCGSLLQGR